MNQLITRAEIKTVSFDSFPIMPISRVIECLEKGFGKEIVSDQAKEIMKQIASSDYIYLRESFEIVQKVLGYRMVSERRGFRGVYYDFIKEKDL